MGNQIWRPKNVIRTTAFDRNVGNFLGEVGFPGGARGAAGRRGQEEKQNYSGTHLQESINSNFRSFINQCNSCCCDSLCLVFL